MSIQSGDDLNTSCVEHGAWTAVPFAPPTNLEQFTLRLGDVDAAESDRIARSGVMTFHAAGCSGDYSNHTPQMAVAAGMSGQVKNVGSAGRPNSPAVPASFFYQLGDVVYMDEDKHNPARNEQSQMYNDQFYAPYTEYGRSIFAIAGNHDGKTHASGEQQASSLLQSPSVPGRRDRRADDYALWPPQGERPLQNGAAPKVERPSAGENGGDAEHSAIAHFRLNFCAAGRVQSPDNRVDGRSTMTQPYVYWRLSTPLAEFIGLYGNIANGGMLDNPAQSDQPQYRWLVAQLSDIRRRSAQDTPRKAVLLTVHYPPYSGVFNFRERGDPTLAQPPAGRALPRAQLDDARRQAETAGAENAVPLGAVLQRAFAESGQRPDAVLSAHAHLYQRLTFRCADGWEIPYLVAGSGGHAPVSSMRHQCDDGLGPPRPLPFDAVAPRGGALAAGDRAQVVAYNDRSFGFLRLTIATRKLIGEFFTVGQPAPVLFDSFVLDMESHRIGA